MRIAIGFSIQPSFGHIQMKSLMTARLCFIALFFFLGRYGPLDSLEPFPHEVQYPFVDEPIDVVIPCSEKDIETLELCVDGIRKNGKNIRRIIVVSREKLTDNAEWFPEANYPFTKYDIAFAIFKDELAALNYTSSKNNRIGWIYQQFLKLYASFIIPDISSNILLLDADTVFIKPVQFLDKSANPYLTISKEYNKVYFEHMDKLIPGLNQFYKGVSGIAHHMIFQRPVLEDLFSIISENHNGEVWMALCSCVDLKDISGSCMSEYEIYFNFILTRTKQAHIRKLKWLNSANLNCLNEYEMQGYHFISFHTHLRETNNAVTKKISTQDASHK